MVRIVALCQGDPGSRRAFSGSARQLFRALARRGSLARAFDVDLSPLRRLVHRALAAVEARRFGATELRAAWSPRGVSERSRVAATTLARLHASEHDAVLLYGTNLHPELAPGPVTRTARPLPTGAALDATFAQLARSREGWFATLSRGEIERAVALQRDVFERCDLLFPRTEWCAASLMKDYGISLQRIVVTSAGSNLDVPPAPRRSNDGRTILFVGRDFERKNGPLVLAAFRAARERRADLRLVVVGPPPVELTRHLVSGGRSGVELVGPVEDGERMRALYEEASLFVMPSRFEPFGVALIEALSAGVPVITLDTDPAREIVVDGALGTLLPREDQALLTEAMLDWLGDRERLRVVGEAAQRHVREHFTWDRAAERVAGAFEQLAPLAAAT
jgi:starch synthase